MYTDAVRAHYLNPHNPGRIVNPSGEAMVRNPADSDTVLITVAIEDDVIRDIRFKCVGCPVAIACCSVATELVLGRPVDEACRLTEQQVAEALGGIPEYKMSCSNLAPEAIRRAIAQWRERNSGESRAAS